LNPPPNPSPPRAGTGAVYDAMVFLQWVALPPQGRQHATLTALSTGRLRLAISQKLLDEVRGIFFRPELQQRLPSLTHERAALILKKTLELADFYPDLPARFSLPNHPKDDHLFDLAIEAQAHYLVTWESRLLKLQTDDTPDAERLRTLAPNLTILTPQELAQDLKLKNPTP
jgi:putative PIN family toxin of toxin-antitoxin system